MYQKKNGTGNQLLIFNISNNQIMPNLYFPDLPWSLFLHHIGLIKYHERLLQTFRRLFSGFLAHISRTK